MSTALTLADLLTALTKDQLQQLLLDALAAQGFPVTAWQSGNPGRTLSEAEATALEQLALSQVMIARGGYLDTATGAWLTYLAQQVYAVDRAEPQAAIYNLTLRNTGTSPQTIAALSRVATTLAGLQFRNTIGGTIQPHGALALPFKAAQTGTGYNVGLADIHTLATALAGVSVTNLYGEVTHVGTGLALIAPAGTPAGGITSLNVVTVTVTLGGNTGTATLSVDVAGDTTYTISNTAVPYLLGTTGMTLYFDTTSAEAGPFVLDDVYTFTPRDPTITAGTDTETDADLRERCRNKWGTLGAGANADAYASWAKASDPGVITRVSAVPNNGTGEVTVTIAGATGQAGTAAVAKANAYITPRLPQCVRLTDDTVSDVELVSISVAGTVYFRTGYLDGAVVALRSAFQAYANGLAIGGEELSSLDSDAKGVALDRIIAICMSVPGAINVALNPAYPPGDTVLTASQLPTFALDSLAVSL